MKGFIVWLVGWLVLYVAENLKLNIFFHLLVWGALQKCIHMCMDVYVCIKLIRCVWQIHLYISMREGYRNGSAVKG